MKYLKIFNTTKDYNNYIESDNASLPNVSKCKDLNKIKFEEKYIRFEDPKMLEYLLSLGIGSNGHISKKDAKNATVVANSTNTEITKFNELSYFTSITESKNGWEGSVMGVIPFYNWTALEEIDISNFTSFGHNNSSGYGDTFYGCTSLRKVTASNKLTKIGWTAFEGCINLQEISGLSGTIEVGTLTFENCHSLTSDSFDNVSFKLSDNAYGSFATCENLTSITLSDTNTTIGNTIFYQDSTLTTVIGGNNITSIGNNAFYNCTSLISAPIVENITSIGDYAFQGCSNFVIEDLSLPNLTSLGRQAFSKVAIKRVSDLGQITSIVQAFRECPELTDIVLPNTLTSINDYAFYNCTKLTSIIIPNSVTSIDHNAFRGCSSLTSVTLSTSLTLLHNSLFWGSGLTSITIPENIITIESDVFHDCHDLQSVIIEGNNLTSIGNSVFAGTSLTSITLPESVTSIGQQLFYSCTNLQSLTILATTPPELGSNLLQGVSNCTIYVPAASVDVYKAAANWSTYADRIQAIPTE